MKASKTEKGKYRRLSRTELLELLIEETERNERLETEIAEVRNKLEVRDIFVKESGTLAEAVMKLNGVFDAAAAACAQYEDNIRRLSTEQALRNAEREAKSLVEASRIIEEAKGRVDRMERETITRCEKIVEIACADVAKFKERIAQLEPITVSIGQADADWYGD